MKKISASLLVAFFLLILPLPSLVLSKGPQREDGERLQVRQEIKEKVAVRLEEARKNIIKDYFVRMIRRFEAAVSRLEKLIERIESRIAKIKESNPTFNLSSQETQINSAKTKIEAVKADLTTLKSEMDALL